MVLNQGIQNEQVQETMIRIRIRDKFVVVNEAPWRVFDQFEFFIYPTSITLTRRFIESLIKFVFEDSSTQMCLEEVEELKKPRKLDFKKLKRDFNQKVKI